MINRLLLLLLFLIITPACKDKIPVFANFAGFTQGTTYSVVYDNRKNITPELLKVDVEKILHNFDLSLSIYLDSSIISKINRNEDAIPDSFFVEVFNRSLLISEMTRGAFDITVGPLVRAWGFGPDAHKSFAIEKRDSLMKLVGMDKVSIINGHLIKSDTGISLDVNAIAQGYSVDVICRYFDNLGILNYLVEIGGEVRAKGTKAGAHWRIGIDRPEENNMSPGESLQAIIKISDKALATSGNYRKFYVEDGIKYSHTIDPRTGYPAKNRLLSATIIADDCTMADGIATACMVMGTDSAIMFINRNPQLSGYLVFSDDNENFKTWISDNLKSSVSESEN
ncbi:MAG TPA: FAD:protein FMN transferase [Bacteroidales bacterium]|nr:FAD:protein FMN transferase [Bacteroidales bacterium]